MLLKIEEEVIDGNISFNLVIKPNKKKKIEELSSFLKILTKEANIENKVYVHRETWAIKLGIHEKTLDRYIKSLIKSNHIIKIPDTYDGTERKIGNSIFLEIVQVPFTYEQLLKEQLNKFIEEFNVKIRK
jgi:hypothetical protein